eukprot:gene36115-48614_t
MDIITGKTKPDDGEVFFDGRTDLTRLDEAAIATDLLLRLTQGGIARQMGVSPSQLFGWRRLALSK